MTDAQVWALQLLMQVAGMHKREYGIDLTFFLFDDVMPRYIFSVA